MESHSRETLKVGLRITALVGKPNGITADEVLVEQIDVMSGEEQLRGVFTVGKKHS